MLHQKGTLKLVTEIAGRANGPKLQESLSPPDYYPERAAAQAHVEAILRRRLRHGYRVLAWQ